MTPENRKDIDNSQSGAHRKIQIYLLEQPPKTSKINSEIESTLGKIFVTNIHECCSGKATL